MKEYNTKFMRRVTVVDRDSNIWDAYFESKEAALEYKKLMEEQGRAASMNLFSWEVKIEK